MLGRLHMSLDECEEAYLNLSRKIFKPKHGRFNKASQWADFLLANEKFDSARLEGAIKDCINSTLGRAEDGKSPEDALLKDKASPCKVYTLGQKVLLDAPIAKPILARAGLSALCAKTTQSSLCCDPTKTRRCPQSCMKNVEYGKLAAPLQRQLRFSIP